MAYEIRLKYGMDGTASKAMFVGVGSDTIVLSGTGFKYDADGYLESGKITKMSYLDPVAGSDPVQTVTLKMDAADLYNDVLHPAIVLRQKIDDWSLTDDTISANSKKIVLQTDDFGKVIITGTNLAEDPTKGSVTGLELFDINGDSIDKVSNLHVSLATALTALGESVDVYDYLTQGDNTITNSGFFPPRLEGGLGDDILRGGNAAFPLAEYIHTAIAGIKADLGTGKVTGGAGADKLIDIDGISGSNFNDTLIGRDDANSFDTFYGNGGKDTINGLRGTDFISGGAGSDKLSGGDGDDILDGGAGNDVLDGGGGKHDVISFAGDSLEENGVTLRLDKTGVQDFGGWGQDTLKGFEGVYGSASGDQLFGSNGNNVMAGGGGADKIKDFKPQDDTISFNHFGFGDLPAGKLSSDAFVEGTEAKDAQDRIIYDKSTGHLYFDADGTGDTEQVLFATLTNKSDLTNADFVGF